jgi:serine/tyrosine/threonine adenylyltransferase
MMGSSNIPLNGPPLSPALNVGFTFDNTYTRLPERFYARLDPTPVAAPRIVKVNVELARELGLDADALASEHGVAILAGNRVPRGAEPIALAYAGHQFGYFVPQLGDGRANLLGELVSRERQRYDIQLKGSGPTPFSRGGDGRATLGPVLREYIVSEAMAALGVPTTRALAAVTTGERVLRDTVLPGAVLTRVAASHLRVGTFEYFAARGDVEGLRMLADYTIARHYPEAALAKERYRALLEGIIARQAQLIAQWMLLGFIHGVMNTDNTSISGETIDYGPAPSWKHTTPPRFTAPLTTVAAMPMATSLVSRCGIWRGWPNHCCPFLRRNQAAKKRGWSRQTKPSQPSSLSLKRPRCRTAIQAWAP